MRREHPSEAPLVLERNTRGGMTSQGQGRKAPPQVRGRLRLEWRGRAAHEDGTSLRLQDAEAVVQHCEMNVEAIGLEVPRDEPGAFEAIAGPGGDRELRDDLGERSAV